MRPKLNGDAKTWGRAFGELALIIVGVLIALAVDDWRTERAAERTARDYLSRIADDVRTDLITYQEGVMWAKNVGEAVDRVLIVYQGYDPSLAEADELVADVVRASWTGDRTRVALRATYDDLINTGNLALLPVEVQDALAAYYAEKERYRQRQDGFDEQMRGGYYNVSPAVLGPDILPELWLQLAGVDGAGFDRRASLDLTEEELAGVVERLRAFPTLWGDIATVKHLAVQKQEIYGNRLPESAQRLLAILEAAGVDSTGEESNH